MWRAFAQFEERVRRKLRELEEAGLRRTLKPAVGYRLLLQRLSRLGAASTAQRNGWRKPS
jgi:hypothetical protein